MTASTVLIYLLIHCDPLATTTIVRESLREADFTRSHAAAYHGPNLYRLNSATENFYKIVVFRLKPLQGALPILTVN